MQLGPRHSLRGSLPVRGLLLGAALGSVGALIYLLIFVVIVFGPSLIGDPARPLFGVDGPVTLEFMATTLLVGMIIGVLPAAVAAAVAGTGIGVALRLTRHRQTPTRAWLTGHVVCCPIVAATVIIVLTATHPDLVWSATGVPLVWIPVLIFVVAGGPFAYALSRWPERSPAIPAEPACAPRRAAAPARGSVRPRRSGGPRRRGRG